MLRIFFVSFFFVSFYTGVLSAQQNCAAEKLAQNRAALSRADRFSGDSLVQICPDLSRSPMWIRSSDMAWFVTTDGQGNRTYYIAHADKKRIIRLFDVAQYAEMITPITGKKVHPKKPAFFIESLCESSKTRLMCKSEGVNVIFDLADGKFHPTAAPSPPVRRLFPREKEPWKSYCTDSTLSIFGRGHNIYLSRTFATGADSIQPLSTDAEPFYSFTTTKTPGADDKLRLWRGSWFRDTHIAYCLLVDYRKVSTMTIVNSIANPAPTTKEYKFELAGDRNVAQYEIVLVYADSARVVRVDIAKFADQEVKLASNFNKSAPWDAIYFTRRNRVGDTLELCAINPFDAKVRVVATETGKPIVNNVLHSYAITGKEIIWWSERDGLGAYYLYDQNGTFKNAITKGNFVAGNIFRIDTLARTMIMEGYGYANGENPYYKHFFKVGFDGRDFTHLTPAVGDHKIEISPGKRYLMDTYSTVETMPRCEIRDVKGRLVLEIPMPGDSALVANGWSRPILEKVKAADDATDLWGIVYTPSNIDTGKKYPIICAVYPGPHTDLIPQEFGIDHDGNSALAQMGFIVVQFGYRGTSPLRGRDFFSYGYGNMRDYALPDCKCVVERLAEKYPFMDLDRVGIFGHSGGGFMSTAAILTYPDFFKVAVAVSGNHDNNIYGKYWAEPYHGVKQVAVKDSTGVERTVFECKVPTTIELASRLKGRLLLITGEIDNNVHPANTMRMVNALIKNNKRFDLQILPGKDHGVYGDYYDNLIRYYFEQYLKDPKEFDIDIIKHN